MSTNQTPNSDAEQHHDERLDEAGVQKALRVSELRYRRLFEAAKDGILILDADTGMIVDVNPFLINLLGYSRDVFLTTKVWELGFLGDAIANEDKFRELQAKGYVRYEDLPLETSDGRRLEVEFVSNVYQVNEHRVIQCNIRDVTERKQAEEALRKSEETYRDLLANLNAGVVVHAPDTSILLSNPAAAKILGLSEEQMAGKQAMDPRWKFLREDGSDIPLEEYPVNQVLSTNEPLRNLLVGVNRPQTGDVAWVLVNGFLAYQKSGQLEQIVINFVDITERKQAEDEKEKLENQLRQSQKMEAVGRLAGGVAHDFNNMLGVILGHADMIMDQMDPDQPFHANLTEIRKAGKRSADLTRQLLAFARKQTVAPKVLDLNQTVEDMLKMLHRLIGEDIDMAWIPGEAVWPVRIDPGQLDQILANLCVNARDAIGNVGKITIETGNMVFDEEYCKEHAGFLPGEYTLLAVSDNGCGMDAETLENVFEPFFTTKESNQGTGLGLATVYGTVKQNNGCFIKVYSEPGKGTTFKIYLPRHAAEAAETKESKPRATERGSETILLVEDEPAILEMTTMMLEQTGYKILAAGTPGEAIALAREYTGEIHLLLTDVVMPEMDGRDLAKNLLSLYPDLTRLFMSGYTANVIAHHGVLDEGIHFIQKPFSIDDLASKVREALEG